MTELEVVGKPAEKAETKVVQWVFEQFVGGALTKAGGAAMDQVLSWIGMKDDGTEELKNRLDKIQQGIDELLKEVKAIRAQLDDLMKELKLSTAEIIIAINESVISQARTAIDTHFGTTDALLTGAGDPTKVTSLGEAIRLRGKKMEVDTAAFAKNVLEVWDIESSVVAIAQVAGEKSGLVTKPLLKGWTDYLIEKNRGAIGLNALTMYLTLETYFQQLLATQFKGIGLVAAAKAHGKSEKEAAVITEAFLAGMAPHLNAQADLFAQCADEIILSVLTDAPTRWLYSPGPTGMADMLTTIARRANVMRAVVRAAVAGGSPNIGGIYGTVIGRNVDFDNPAIRTITPKSFDASAGVPLDALDAGAGNAPIEWERSTDREYGQLRPKAKSGFRAFHYYWPWKATEPEVGKPIDPAFEGGLTPRRYSLATLEPTTTKDEPSVLIADFGQMRCVEGIVFADPAVADAASSSDPATGATNVNQNRVAYRNNEARGYHALRADEHLLRPLANGTLDVHMNYQKQQGGPVGYRLEFPLFRYQGDAAKLELFCDRQFVLELYANVQPIGKDGYTTMYMTPQATISLKRARKGQAAALIPLYDTDKEHSLWQQGTGARSADTSAFNVDVSLYDTAGSEDFYSLVVDLNVHNEVHGSSVSTDPGGWAKGRIQYLLSGFRIAWR